MLSGLAGRFQSVCGTECTARCSKALVVPGLGRVCTRQRQWVPAPTGAPNNPCLTVQCCSTNEANGRTTCIYHQALENDCRPDSPCTRTHTHTHTSTHTKTHTQVHKLKHPHLNTHAHTPKHSKTHTNTHTHQNKHTHTQKHTAKHTN